MFEMQLKRLTPSFFLDAHNYMLQGYAYETCKHTTSILSDLQKNEGRGLLRFFLM